MVVDTSDYTKQTIASVLKEGALRIKEELEQDPWLWAEYTPDREQFDVETMPRLLAISLDFAILAIETEFGKA